MLRAETYGSISINEVPAMGRVSHKASSTTAPQHAKTLGKMRTAICQAAKSVIQMHAA